MLRLYLCFIFIYVTCAKYFNPGPRYPPTKGEIWPKPRSEIKSNKYYSLDLGYFKIISLSSNNTCALLTRAMTRYTNLMNSKKYTKFNRHLPHGTKRVGSIKLATVEISGPCSDNDMPFLGMDEEYNLTVSDQIDIRSKSVWGAMRGMETMLHLVYKNDAEVNAFFINSDIITDGPAYTHRGLLIDTGRHFISLPLILKTLEAMEMNKMNVLHWRIVDDQSFPYESKLLPELSARGAFHKSMVYSRADIANVIQFARDRGIRVVPEFDIPSHTRSWGIAYPEILTPCYNNDQVFSLGPLNPIKAETYKLLNNLFLEVQDLFPDKTFHIGGDEVELNCWSSNPDIKEFMRINNITSPTQLLAEFNELVLKFLNYGVIPVVWQDVFTDTAPLKNETIVQVWKSGYRIEMEKILKAGHRVIFSSLWYLDSADDWNKFYEVDPRSMITDQTLWEGIIGGEACMWGEYVDDNNIIARVWPRASAVAERLWSGRGHTSKYTKYIIYNENIVSRRLEEHACRMLRRGINAQPPNGPGFCVA